MKTNSPHDLANTTFCKNKLHYLTHSIDTILGWNILSIYLIFGLFKCPINLYLCEIQIASTTYYITIIVPNLRSKRSTG